MTGSINFSEFSDINPTFKYPGTSRNGRAFNECCSTYSGQDGERRLYNEGRRSTRYAARRPKWIFGVHWNWRRPCQEKARFYSSSAIVPVLRFLGMKHPGYVCHEANKNKVPRQDASQLQQYFWYQERIASRGNRLQLAWKVVGPEPLELYTMILTK